MLCCSSQKENQVPRHPSFLWACFSTHPPSKSQTALGSRPVSGQGARHCEERKVGKCCWQRSLTLWEAAQFPVNPSWHFPHILDLTTPRTSLQRGSHFRFTHGKNASVTGRRCCVVTTLTSASTLSVTSRCSTKSPLPFRASWVGLISALRCPFALSVASS